MKTVQIEKFAADVQTLIDSVGGGSFITITREKNPDGSPQTLTVTWESPPGMKQRGGLVTLSPEYATTLRLRDESLYISPAKFWISGYVEGIGAEVVALAMKHFVEDNASNVDLIVPEITSGRLKEKAAIKLMHKERDRAFAMPIDLQAAREFVWRWGEGAPFDPIELLVNVHKARVVTTTFGDSVREASRQWLRDHGQQVPQEEQPA